jgi:hypothetical protein
MGRYGWLALTLFLLGPACTAPAQVSLRWKFKEGETFYVEEKVHTHQTLKMPDTVQPQDLDQTKVSRFKVLKVTPDGGAVLEQKIESVQAVPQSASAKADPSVLRHFQGAVFRITLDGKQRVTGFEGYKALVDRVARENPDAAELLRKVLTRENLQQPVEALLGFAPEKAVAKGDHWQIKSKVPFANFGALNVTDTYTLEGKEQAEKDVARVSIARAVTYAPPPAAGGLPFKVVSGDVKVVKESKEKKVSKGSLLFNVAAAKVVRLEMHQTLRGLFTVALGNQRLELEIEQEQSRTVRVLDSSPLKR